MNKYLMEDYSNQTVLQEMMRGNAPWALIWARISAVIAQCKASLATKAYRSSLEMVKMELLLIPMGMEGSTIMATR